MYLHICIIRIGDICIIRIGETGAQNILYLLTPCILGGVTINIFLKYIP